MYQPQNQHYLRAVTELGDTRDDIAAEKPAGGNV